MHPLIFVISHSESRLTPLAESLSRLLFDFNLYQVIKLFEMRDGALIASPILWTSRPRSVFCGSSTFADTSFATGHIEPSILPSNILNDLIPILSLCTRDTVSISLS